MVEEPPETIEAGEALTEMVGAGTVTGGGATGGATLTVTERDAVPPVPTQRKVYVLAAVKIPVD